MKKQNTMKHRRDVFFSKIEDLDEQISEKEQLMRDRGHGDILEGHFNHRAMYTYHWSTYGCRSLRALYAKRKSLIQKLVQCDKYFEKKDLEHFEANREKEYQEYCGKALIQLQKEEYQFN